MQVTCTDQVSPVHGIHEIKSRRPCLQSLTLFDFSLFYFSLLLFFFFLLCFIFKKLVLSLKTDLLKKMLWLVEEGLDGGYIDDIGNLEDSSRLEFIDEECENLITWCRTY